MTLNAWLASFVPNSICNGYSGSLNNLCTRLESELILWVWKVKQIRTGFCPCPWNLSSNIWQAH